MCFMFEIPAGGFKYSVPLPRRVGTTIFMSLTVGSKAPMVFDAAATGLVVPLRRALRCCASDVIIVDAFALRDFE